MIYGMYPEIVLSNDTVLLAQLADNYLYKDILAYQNIKSHGVLIRLLQALALQIGNEVSFNELSRLVGIDKKTVENYITILEQAFIIFRLRPFSRNVRSELKKLRKIYFWDVGLRNALINNFNALHIRQDSGALFENFIIAERLKSTSNAGIRRNVYFWRTHEQHEIDYLEEADGRLCGFEIKMSQEKFKAPGDFLKAYKNSDVQLINKKNCLGFILA